MEEQIRAQKRILAERVKELECLFAVSRMFNQPGLSFSSVLSRLCAAIRTAWQFPRKTCVRIVVRHEEARTSGFQESGQRLCAALRRGGKKVGSIEVYFLGEPPSDGGDAFLPTERRLLAAIAELTENMLVRKDAEREIKRTSTRLQEQKRQLERKNIALKEVLAQIEIEKREIREQIGSQITASILPMVRRLGDRGVPADQRERYAGIVSRELAAIGSAATRAVSGARLSLSPREVEIADLVRGGASSKEIAKLLHVSEPTVERHRHNIRRKIGISGKNVNLVTWLNEGN